MPPPFAARTSKQAIERGLDFQPLFDAGGLIPVIVTDAGTGAVLMFAWMNAEALAMTLASKTAHFWSRSRGRIWKKGEESGNVFTVVEMLTDCDQDVIWLRVTVSGRGAACHTGATSCFYRSVTLGEGSEARLTAHPGAKYSTAGGAGGAE